MRAQHEQGFAEAISKGGHDANRQSMVSISCGLPESKRTGQAIAAMSAAFADAALHGMTVTAASGDSLATDGVEDARRLSTTRRPTPPCSAAAARAWMASGGKLGRVWGSDSGGTGGGVSALFARPA